MKMVSRTPSTNGPLPDHPLPPAVAPTTVEKFLGIPTTTSVHFACTLFALVETLAFKLSGVAGASYNFPRPSLAVPLVAALFFLLLWHQRRCVRDLLIRSSYSDCEAGSTATTAEAVMSVERHEDMKFFTGFQAVVLLGMAFLMLVFNCWIGHAGVAIVAGALASGVEFLGFLEFCREIGLEDVPAAAGKKVGEEREEHQEVAEASAASSPTTTGTGTGLEDVSVGGKKGREEREEHQEVAEASAASSPSTTGTGTKQLGQHLHRRLSCIPEVDGDDSSEHGGDNHPPAVFVLSQEAQDLVWNRVRYLAARETLSERRRKKHLLRRAMRESQGVSTREKSGDGGFPARHAVSTQRMREEHADSDRDRQVEVDGGGLRKARERMEEVLGETRDDADTSAAFSSRQPLSTTMPTMGSNPLVPVPQQQSLPAMENLSHLPAAMDRTEPPRQAQQQAWHIEAMNHLARAKDSEIATLRTQMEGMTRYFRTREEAHRAAHAVEVANAWRNAQVLFEKVGKLEARLERVLEDRNSIVTGCKPDEEGDVSEEVEWIGVGSTEQEERMGRKLGIFAVEKEERWFGVERNSARKRQQQQQQQQQKKEEVVGEEGESIKQDLVINLPLCQNAGCFCHFPVVPQRLQQRQRKEETSKDEHKPAIVSQDHVAETFDEDETDDDAFTIILDSDPPSLSSPSSSPSHDVESPNNLAPPDGSETPLCQNADCFCHFPVSPPLPRQTRQAEQRQEEEEQTAQTEDRRLNVPDRDKNAGSENKNEDEGEDADEEDDEETFTIFLESSIPSLPSSSPSSSFPRAESPEDRASVEGGSEMTLSEWEMTTDSSGSDDSSSGSDFDSDGLLDEWIHV